MATLSFERKNSWQNKEVEITLNNRITAKGRYLMPREWGRDPFYTLCPGNEMKVLVMLMR
jgi:hypothetical protein